MFLLGVPQRQTTLSLPRQILHRGMSAAFSRRRLLVRGPAGSDRACLTFDDGPHPEQTPAILNTLNHFGVKATFFIAGERAVTYPELVEKIEAEGHVIGHRGYFQEKSTVATEEELLEELLMTEYRLHEITGQTPRLFRPRDNELTVANMRILWRRDQTVVLWNRHPVDQSTAALLTDFAARPVRCRDIVRLSESHFQVARVLPKMISSIIRDGIKLGTPLEWTK